MGSVLCQMLGLRGRSYRVLTPIECDANTPASFRLRSFDNHYVGGLRSQMNLTSWEYELSFENDELLRSYLYRGILYGFNIVDAGALISPYICTNYRSVTTEPCHSFINNFILKEIAEGKYVISDIQPVCVHALGAVKKSSGAFRPIADCRRPEGSSINSFMLDTHQPFVYNTVDFVCTFCVTNVSCQLSTLVQHTDPFMSIHQIGSSILYSGRLRA